MTRLTYERAASLIADLAGDEGPDSEYTRGQIEFAVTALGYDDDGEPERERLTRMVREMLEVYPAGTLLYVVSYAPREQGSGSGGLDWFPTAEEAARRFVEDVTGEDRETFVHTLWTALLPHALYGRESVTEYLDENWGEPNGDIVGTAWRL